MTATMLDGINSDAEAISRQNPAYVAGYIDGAYAWSQADWALFPHATKVQIAVTASGAGDVLDVENGDATPADAPGWIQRRKAAAYDRPTIYTALSNVPAVREATGSYVAGRDYDLWVADWTGSAHVVTLPGPGQAANAAVVQYANKPQWDESCVNDPGWPHRTAAAPPKTTTTAAAADYWPAGVTLQQGSTGSAVKALQYALRDSGLGLSALIDESGGVDGEFGKDTAAAVRAYEEKEGLTVDAGIAGTQVRASLISHGFMTAAGEGK